MALARSFLKALAQRLWLWVAIGVIGGGALAFVMAGGGGALAQSAPGGWTVCNQTSYILEAATGRPEGKAVLVSGWMRLRPGECRVAAAAPLQRAVYYLYGRTSTAHRGGRRQWTGPAHLCIDPQNSFAIENPPSCKSMGLEERTFREVKINKKENWRTNFAESEPYTLDSARSAGFARLLSDAGYNGNSYGIVDSRQMAAAIARFRADTHLNPGANSDQVIDSLENAARKRADAVGLTLCNRTAGRVWTSIARRRGEGWESRGWWGLGPGGCARTIDDSLIQGVYFVDAVLESPQGDRALAAGGESFCTSPTKFAIIGREECASRWYDVGLFTPISPQGRSGMVVEFFERDFLPAGAQAKHVEIPKMADDTINIAQTGIKHGLVPNSAPTRGKSQQAAPPVATVGDGEE